MAFIFPYLPLYFFHLYLIPYLYVRLYIDFPLFIFIYMLILCDFLFCFYFIIISDLGKAGPRGELLVGGGGRVSVFGVPKPPPPPTRICLGPP